MQTMKKVILILAILLIVRVESEGQRQVGNDELITVDVRRDYSSKKELILQDFFDVEYVYLETNNDFLNQGVVMDVGKEIILVKNRIDDGDIFVYDRQGKALRKINRKGQGGEEYSWIYSITLDEDNGEMFVNDANLRRIYVYDLYGKFKRKFEHSESANYKYYTTIFNYDKNNLIGYDEIFFHLISKQDGQITKEIKIPFKEKKNLSQFKQDPNAKNRHPNMIIPDGFIVAGTIVNLPGALPIIPYKGKWILTEFSSDTVYTFMPDYKLTPIIARTPSIQSVDTETVLILRLNSERYYFIDKIRNEYDWNTSTGFPRSTFVYDKQEKTFSEYALYNGDFSTKKQIPITRFRLLNHEIAAWQAIESFDLVEDYKTGKLKDGKLKEIASKLDEEDNPVVMLIKHKM